MAGPRVVTIGGGHGQAVLVTALARLRCEVTALVSVADDGGCSGRLREEMGMPPPGDIRRCLLALSPRPELVARFDERLPEEVSALADPQVARSAGNLVLAEMFLRLGGLQRAVDWAAELLGCVGRVVPLAETAGILQAYDQARGPLSGESTIERESVQAIVVNVDGPEEANPEAKRALAAADLVFIGPGSFLGSTLAALTTGDVASSVVATQGRRVLVQNLGREAGTTIPIEEHERILHDHLVIKSGGQIPSLDVLVHGDERGARTRPDGSTEYVAFLRREGENAHRAEHLADAIAAHFGLEASGRLSHTPSPVAPADALARFDEVLASARRRLLGEAVTPRPVTDP